MFAMALIYRLAVLAVILIFAQETFQDEIHIHTSATLQPDESEVNHEDINVAQVAPFEWTARTDRALEPRRRRPDKGWGAMAPVLLAISSILPLLLTGLAALAGKALMSSILALAIAGFNLFRSTQPPPSNGF